MLRCDQLRFPTLSPGTKPLYVPTSACPAAAGNVVCCSRSHFVSRRPPWQKYRKFFYSWTSVSGELKRSIPRQKRPLSQRKIKAGNIVERGVDIIIALSTGCVIYLVFYPLYLFHITPTLDQYSTVTIS